MEAVGVGSLRGNALLWEMTVFPVLPAASPRNVSPPSQRCQLPCRPVPAVRRQMLSTPPDPKPKILLLMLPRSSFLTNSSFLLLKLRFPEALWALDCFECRERLWSRRYGRSTGRPQGAGLSQELRNREGRARRA